MFCFLTFLHNNDDDDVDNDVNGGCDVLYAVIFYMHKIFISKLVCLVFRINPKSEKKKNRHKRERERKATEKTMKKSNLNGSFYVR